MQSGALLELRVAKARLLPFILPRPLRSSLGERRVQQSACLLLPPIVAQAALSLSLSPLVCSSPRIFASCLLLFAATLSSPNDSHSHSSECTSFLPCSTSPELAHRGETRTEIWRVRYCCLQPIVSHCRRETGGGGLFCCQPTTHQCCDASFLLQLCTQHILHRHNHR